VQLFSETIDSITERYNSVVETINAPNDYKFLDGIEISKRLVIYFFFIFIIHNIYVVRVQDEHNTFGIEKKHDKKEKRYEGKNVTMNCSSKNL